MLSPSVARTMRRTITKTVDTSANAITVHPPPEVVDASWLFSGLWWFGGAADGRCFMSTLDDARKCVRVAGWAPYIGTGINYCVWFQQSNVLRLTVK